MKIAGRAILAWLPLVPAPQSVQKVNAPLVSDPSLGGGSANGIELNFRGTRVLLAGDLKGDGDGELWSVPFAGGPLARLSEFERTLREPLVRVRSAPGLRKVVFWTDPVTSGVHELFVAPDDGSTPPLRLHAPYTGGQEVGGDFVIAGNAVLFRSTQRQPGRFELFRAPLDASTAPVLLSGTLVAGGSLGSSAFQNEVFELSSAGDRVVYLADAILDNRIELFSVPVDGSSAPLRISTDLPSGGKVSDFMFTPDGSRVLYVADQDVPGRHELYSVPTTGGVVVRVSAIPVSGGDVQRAQVGARGPRVVYTADALTNNRVELFSAPVDASSAPVRLNPPLGAGNEVLDFRTSSDGAWVVYLSRQLDQWVVPVDGSSAAVQLLGPTLATASMQQVVDLSATQALCLADQDADGRAELYLARLDASEAPRMLTDAAQHLGDSTAAISPDGTRAWFLQLDAEQRVELFGVRLDGSAPAQRLSPPLPPGGRVVTPRFRADGAVAFLCTAHDLRQLSVWSYVGGAPRELTPSLPPPPTVGDVSAYAWSPDATHILYGADRFEDRMACVTSVSLSTGTESVTPQTNGTILSILFPPGGERFAYTRSSLSNVFPSSTDTSLFAGPLDAAETALHVVGDSLLGTVLFPDSERALVELTNSAFPVEPRGRLVLAQLDGSQAPRELTPLLGRPSAVSPVALAPRTGRALFGVFDLVTAAYSGLFAARLDVAEPAERLDLANHAQPRVLALLARPQDDLALFVADLASPDLFELFAVPADGSRLPRRLHPPLASPRKVSPEFRLSPAGTEVVFRSDAREEESHELFVTRVADGVVRPLSGALVAGGDVLAAAQGTANFWISPDGLRVVYLADQAIDEVVEFWSVPLDASAPPVRLHAPLSGALDALPEAHFTPDGRRVVFPLELTLDGTVELVIAPVDGSAPPTVLSAPFPPGGGLKTNGLLGSSGALALAPGGRHAFYLAEQDVDGVVELFSVALDASRAPLRWNAPLVPGGNVVSFALRPTPGAVLYLADQEEDEAFELWLASFLDAPPGRSASAAPTGSASVTLPE